jgi:hypothetical protein
LEQEDVSGTNHIVETCAELALHRVIIYVDQIFDYYKTETELEAIEDQLWKLLRGVQTSGVLAKEGRSH